MTVIDDPFEPTDPSDAALDRVLAQARWEVSVDVEDRLRQQWIALSRKRRMVAPVYAMLAAAAAIAVALGTIFLVQNRPNVVVIAPVVPEPTDVKYLMIPAGPSVHVESRQATLLEQLTLMQATTQKPFAAVPVDPPQPDPAVAALTRQLGDRNLEKRFAAAQALAEMNDPSIIPALAEMVRAGINAREALLALKLSKDPTATETINGLALSGASRAQLAADALEIQSRL